ncbi:LexA family protein [Rhizobium sp. SYY.PMSO]|uniref:LexA family protein n=1 Tax=Rhizobiaceae TaxID=82115 RepID=UPI0039902676
MNDTKKIGERLKEARRHAGFATAVEAAESLGIRYPTYAAHENGSRGVVRAAQQYARRYRVSLDWLLRGVGAGPGETDEVLSDRAIDVPLLTTISAGELQRDDIADEAKGIVTVGQLPEGDWIALEVVGDSMDRISPPNSIIIVNRADKRLVPNACYVIADEDGQATYKRYRPSPDRFEPVSTNSAHEPIFPDNTPPVVGRVKMSILKM